jgi:5-methylcytosine-specific restriction endonuclease McrA
VSDYTADSRKFRKEKRAFLAAYPVCWICGHAGSTEIDHYFHASTYPELRYEQWNWRSAHGTIACGVCGRHCNQERGTSMEPPVKRPQSRIW